MVRIHLKEEKGSTLQWGVAREAFRSAEALHPGSRHEFRDKQKQPDHPSGRGGVNQLESCGTIVPLWVFSGKRRLSYDRSSPDHRLHIPGGHPARLQPYLNVWTLGL